MKINGFLQTRRQYNFQQASHASCETMFMYLKYATSYVIEFLLAI